MVRGSGIAGLLVLACALGACGGAGGGGGEPAPAPAPPLAPAPVDPPVASPVHPNFQAADVVIGQDTLTAAAPNRGVTPGANTLAYAYGAAVDAEGRLFIADSGNDRVLIYDTVPHQDGAAAVKVLGQPSMEASGGGVGQDRLNSPLHVAIGAGRLAITDWMNNRVLVYSTVPTETGALPDSVVGQPGFDSNAEGCASGFSRPQASAITPDGRLIVADTYNHRVLIWPRGNLAGPEFVLGQQEMDQCDAADDNEDGNPDVDPASRFSLPVGVWSDGSRLVVTTGPRVLVWTTFPSTSYQAADLVLGQDDFEQFDLPLESGRSVGYPSGVSSDGVSLAVVDTFGHRVLIWNVFPTVSGQQPDSVLGVSGLTEQRPDTSYDVARTFNFPAGVVMLPTRTVVMDTENSRVLVFRRPDQQ